MAWVWWQNPGTTGTVLPEGLPLPPAHKQQVGPGGSSVPLSFAVFISIHVTCTVLCMLGRWQP